MFNHHHSLPEERFLSMFIADQGLELNFDELYCICLKNYLVTKTLPQRSKTNLKFVSISKFKFSISLFPVHVKPAREI